ncbi:MAG: RNA pseudouridine synthase [Candidatus Vecturithrix sp.]|jgi:23S rRNA pseudouridine1911/1915/1917 synthase|nr:RNA pseudouridine synthase [Candidatus Vecturithrix sp.]
MTISDLSVLYEDNHLLVVLKPAGVLVQGDVTGDVSLLAISKQWLAEKHQKPGNVFLGLVHRLDRPVSGIVVFAKTSKAANRLCVQFRERTIQKTYLAVVEGRLVSASDTLIHYIQKRSGNRRVHIFSDPHENSDRAELSYQVLEETADKSLLQVQIHTGRHHQIRAQFSAIGHPILGDHKYRSSVQLPGRTIALFAFQLGFSHPTQPREFVFQAIPPEEWPWTLFIRDNIRALNEDETPIQSRIAV